MKCHHSLIVGGLSSPVSLQQPSYAVTTKKFNYLLVKTGTLMLKARSDLSGYIPGQVIRLATEIHNKSGKDTGCVLASLIQVAARLCPLIFNSINLWIGANLEFLL